MSSRRSPAARRLRSSYCCLAHGKVLLEQFGEPVARIARDHHDAGLSPVDVAVMDLAERVIDDATAIGEDELRPFRELGLSEAEITGVVLAASARSFFSKTLDALGRFPMRPMASWRPTCAESWSWVARLRRPEPRATARGAGASSRTP